MVSTEFQIPFAEGLHARPASELVKICQKFKSSIRMTKGETTIDPKSILGIMSLGAAFGDLVNIQIDGDDEVDFMSGIKEYFQV